MMFSYNLQDAHNGHSETLDQVKSNDDVSAVHLPKNKACKQYG